VRGDVDVVAKVRRLLTPQSIALVGATENSFWSRALLQNFEVCGYRGALHLVHPRQKEQFGRPCYPSLLDIPAAIDHAYVMTGTQHAMAILRDCARKGIHGVTMLTSGFKETDEAGAEREKEIVAFCQDNDIALLGPNCLGFVNARLPVPAFALLMGEAPLPGHVGMLLQSGALLNHIQRHARTRNIGLSYLISSGNEAVLDDADFLRFLVEDPDTKVVGALIEGIGRPAAFAAVAEEAIRRGKPIVALKTGRSVAAARVAIAHTASLTGADAVVDALFKQLGIVRVNTIEDLVETCGFLQAYGWPEGRRAGVVTPSGGSCSVISDLCVGTAIELPDFGPATKAQLKEILPAFGTAQNPMDTTGVIVLDATLIPRTANVVAADPDLDLLVVVQDPPRDPGPVPSRNDERMQLLADTLARSPKWACAIQTTAGELTTYGREVTARWGVHLGNGLSLGVNALDQAIRYGEARRRVLARRSDLLLSNALVVPAASLGQRVLNEVEAKALLRAHGIATPREEVALTPDDAVHQAEAIGYPVVLKVLAADVPHKTEAGGVALNLRTPDEVRAAFERIVVSVRSYKPDAAIEGIVVAAQVSGAVEMMAGVTVDPQFGPVVVTGLGGIFVEVLNDVAMRLPPFDEVEALAMLDQLRGRPVLDGVRGRPPADVAALAQALVRLGNLALEQRDHLLELDVNPLFVLPAGQGIRAADALVVVRQ
jgi:acyl-CoA synthetase (NDP forming)